RIVARALLQLGHGIVEDPLRGVLLSLPHHRVDELLDQRGVVQRIGLNFSDNGSSSAWHTLTLRLRPLGPVLRTSLLALRYTGGIERATDNVVADTGEILDTASANQHDRVLLQIVPDTGDVRGHFDPVGQANARDLTQR